VPEANVELDVEPTASAEISPESKLTVWTVDVATEVLPDLVTEPAAVSVIVPVVPTGARLTETTDALSGPVVLAEQAPRDTGAVGPDETSTLPDTRVP
jgi:hypothetical protein